MKIKVVYKDEEHINSFIPDNWIDNSYVRELVETKKAKIRLSSECFDANNIEIFDFDIMEFDTELRGNLPRRLVVKFENGYFNLIALSKNNEVINISKIGKVVGHCFD